MRGPILVVLLVFLGGCRAPVPPPESSEQALRRRIARCGGKCPAAGRLRRALERMHFAMAARQGSLAAWRWFLAEHPHGLLAPQARKRLVSLRIRRALRHGDRWALEVLLVEYAGTPEGRRVAAALERVLWKEVQQARRPEAVRMFLRRFPRSRFAQAARRLLGELEYERLGPNAPLAELRAFLEAFPESGHVRQVKEWLAGRVRHRIALLGDWKDLDEYVRRFGTGPEYERLRKALARRKYLEAAAHLDATGLQYVAERSAGPEVVDARTLLGFLRRFPGRAARLRALAEAALPFRPSLREDSLVLATAVEAPEVAVSALRALGYFPTVRSLKTLLAAAITGPPTLACAAFQALRIWTRSTPPALRRVVAEVVAEGGGSGRFGVQAAVLGAALGLRGKGEPVGEPGGLVVAAAGFRLKPSGSRAERLVAAVRRTLRAYAAQVSEKRPVARRLLNAALGAEALGGLLEWVGSGAPRAWSGRLRSLGREARRLAEAARERVRRAGLAVRLDVARNVILQAERHEAGRIRALRRLCRIRGQAARLVCAAVREVGGLARSAQERQARPHSGPRGSR